MFDMEDAARKASGASYVLASASTAEKNRALLALAERLDAARAEISEKNAADVEAARANGLSEAKLDRLTLTKARLDEIIGGVRKVASLPDPVGEEFDSRVLPNGLRLRKRRVPIGVLGVIYEARPNVTVDIASLALKTGNACILRGGSETFGTNMVLTRIIREALAESSLPEASVTYIADTDRKYVGELLTMDKYVDMIIPRGGRALAERCRKESTVPVIVGGFGVSHIFVDETADLERSLRVIENSKIQRPAACNSLDTVLVHEKIAERFLPMLAELFRKDKVKIAAEPKAYEILKKAGAADLETADEETFDTEWLSLSCAVKVVSGVDGALDHMRAHGASHSDAIMTDSASNAEKFMNGAGSAAVYVNASTRFTDGGQFGLGAEVAISTQKLHARGPMGLTELTTYHWICTGDYLTRS